MAALLVVLWAFGVSAVVSRGVAAALGASIGPLVPWVLLGIPVGLILYRALMSQGIRLPCLVPFLLTMLVFSLREVILQQAGLRADFRYVWLLLLFYAAFIALVNAGLDVASQARYTRVVTWLASALLAAILVALGLGRGLQAPGDGTTLFGVHANGASFAVATVIGLILSRSLTETSERPRDWLVIGGLVSIVVLFASRGSMLVIVALLATYGVTRAMQRHPKTALNLLVIAVLAAAFVVLSYFSVDVVTRRFAGVERFVMEGGLTARPESARVTWISFTRSPLAGHGFWYAGRDVVSGYTFSNFHYTQVLAAYGILGFIPYFWFIWRVFGRNLRDPRSRLHAILAFGGLALYNWALIMPLALVAYSALVIRADMLSEEALAGAPQPDLGGGGQVSSVAKA